jgi:hypothetical protein
MTYPAEAASQSPVPSDMRDPDDRSRQDLHRVTISIA